ncbi:hypothetical protein RRG08_051645 [Elysia crispata]|uniref:Uncharacterized protein n=1 Tax=Elysia crispata TaxID=231223 RepID=A0AAE1DRK7_9GAST|nr:hypothetical protein RRG08_051645 [Elysia crispata]
MGQEGGRALHKGGWDWSTDARPTDVIIRSQSLAREDCHKGPQLPGPVRADDLSRHPWHCGGFSRHGSPHSPGRHAQSSMTPADQEMVVGQSDSQFLHISLI